MAKRTAKGILKTISLFTLTCFVFTQIGWSAPAVGTTVPTREMSSLASTMLAIPAELGQVTDSVIGDPSAPAFIHIQSAHGNFQAEKNIEKLLGYIEKNSSVKLMLLEGAAGKLNPGLFRLFPQHPDFNRKVTDKLMEEGYLTGPERFLIENDPRPETSDQRLATRGSRVKSQVSSHKSGVEAFGIENLESYKQDREAFIKVVKSEKTAEKFLGSLRSTIDRRFSQKMNKDLLNLVRQEEAFGSGTLSFEGWLKALGGGSRQHLKVDLSDAFYQDQYPFMIRYYRLQAIAAKIDEPKALAERDLFLAELKTRKVPEDVVQLFTRGLGTRTSGLESTSDKNEQRVPSPESRLLKAESRRVSGFSPLRAALESAFAKLPRDFSMKQWPNWTLYAQNIILTQELEAKGLQDETAHLKDKILNKLAKTAEEKEYLSAARKLYLLRRLFSLELTRVEYEELRSSRDSYLVPRDSKVRATKTNDESRAPSLFLPSSPESRVPSPRAEALFASAMQFYETAVVRENHMFQNALKKMSDAKEQRAVIVTGGFHADGLKKLAQEKNASYIQISPRISEVAKKDREVYVNSVLGTKDNQGLGTRSSGLDKANDQIERRTTNDATGVSENQVQVSKNESRVPSPESLVNDASASNMTAYLQTSEHLGAVIGDAATKEKTKNIYKLTDGMISIEMVGLQPALRAELRNAPIFSSFITPAAPQTVSLPALAGAPVTVRAETRSSLFLPPISWVKHKLSQDAAYATEANFEPFRRVLAGEDEGFQRFVKVGWRIQSGVYAFLVYAFALALLVASSLAFLSLIVNLISHLVDSREADDVFSSKVSFLILGMAFVVGNSMTEVSQRFESAFKSYFDGTAAHVIFDRREAKARKVLDLFKQINPNFVFNLQSTDRSESRRMDAPRSSHGEVSDTDRGWRAVGKYFRDFWDEFSVRERITAIIPYVLLAAMLGSVYHMENVRSSHVAALVAEQRQSDPVLDLIMTKAPEISPEDALSLLDDARFYFEVLGDFEAFKSAWGSSQGFVMESWEVRPLERDAPLMNSMLDLGTKPWDGRLNGGGLSRRVAAAKALGERQDPRALSTLKKYVNDEPESFRQAVLEAIEKIQKVDLNRSESRTIAQTPDDLNTRFEALDLKILGEGFWNVTPADRWDYVDMLARGGRELIRRSWFLSDKFKEQAETGFLIPKEADQAVLSPVLVNGETQKPDLSDANAPKPTGFIPLFSSDKVSFSQITRVLLAFLLDEVKDLPQVNQLPFSPGSPRILLVAPFEKLDLKVGSYLAPPFGIYRIANYFRLFGIQVDIFDPNLRPSDELLQMVRDNKYDVIGSSTYDPTIQHDLVLAKRMKEASPDSIFVVGGEAAPYSTQKLLGPGNPFDVLVRGLGEFPLLDMVHAYREKGRGLLRDAESMKDIKGILWTGNNGEIASSPPMLQLDTIDHRVVSLFFDTSIVPYEDYWDLMEKLFSVDRVEPDLDRIRTVRLITTSHCSMNCTFCSARMFLRDSYASPKTLATGARHPMLMLGAEEIVQVLKNIQKYHPKTRTIFFNEDDFLVLPKRVSDLADAVQREFAAGGLERGKFNFIGLGRIDKVNPELLEKMKAIGFTQLNYGIEHFSDKVLEDMKKNVTGAKAIRGLDWTLEAGIIPLINLIPFYPTATVADVMETMDLTVDFIRKGALVSYWPFIEAFRGATIMNMGYEVDEKLGILLPVDLEMRAASLEAYHKKSAIVEEIKQRYGIQKKLPHIVDVMAFILSFYRAAKASPDRIKKIEALIKEKMAESLAAVPAAPKLLPGEVEEPENHAAGYPDGTSDNPDDASRSEARKPDADKQPGDLEAAPDARKVPAIAVSEDGALSPDDARGLRDAVTAYFARVQSTPGHRPLNYVYKDIKVQADIGGGLFCNLILNKGRQKYIESTIGAKRKVSNIQPKVMMDHPTGADADDCFLCDMDTARIIARIRFRNADYILSSNINPHGPEGMLLAPVRPEPQHLTGSFMTLFAGCVKALGSEYEGSYSEPAASASVYHRHGQIRRAMVPVLKAKEADLGLKLMSDAGGVKVSEVSQWPATAYSFDGTDLRALGNVFDGILAKFHEKEIPSNINLRFSGDNFRVIQYPRIAGREKPEGLCPQKPNSYGRFGGLEIGGWFIFLDQEGFDSMAELSKENPSQFSANVRAALSQTSISWGEASEIVQAGLTAAKIRQTQKENFRSEKREDLPAAVVNGSEAAKRPFFTGITPKVDISEIHPDSSMITGSTGFIGSKLARQLATQGDHPVVAPILDRERSEMDKLWAVIRDPAIPRDTFRFAEAGDKWDLMSWGEDKPKPAELEEFLSHSAILYHLAAQTSSRPLKGQTYQQWAVNNIVVNVLMTKLLAAIARKTGKPMVYSSSLYAFVLNSLFEKPVQGEITEETPIPWRPQTQVFGSALSEKADQYVAAYMAGESTLPPVQFIENWVSDFQIPAPDGSRFNLFQMLRAYQEFEAFKKTHDTASIRARLVELGKQFPEDLMFGFYALTKVMAEPDVMNLPAGTGAVLRFTNVYGPDMRPDAPRVLMEKISRGETASVTEDSRYFVSWKDVVEALAKAGKRLRERTRDSRNFLIHVVPDGKPQRLEKLYSLIVRIVSGLIGGLPAAVAPQKKKDTPILRIPKISAARLTKHLGRKPATLEAGLRDFAIEMLRPPPLAERLVTELRGNPQDRKTIERGVQDVLASGWYAGKFHVQELEQKMAAKFGVKHCIAVGSGTEALAIALRALKIGPGDEVITTSLSYIATANAIIDAGAKPVFVDIDPVTYNLNEAQVEAAITPRTKAIMPVYLFGQAADLDVLTSVAERHHLKIIGDMAQAAGATYKGKSAAAYGDAATLSLDPTKTIYAIGKGGVILTNDDALAADARSIRSHGNANAPNVHRLIGMNGTMHEIPAMSAVFTLGHLDEWVRRRAQMADLYGTLLKDLPTVVVPETGKDRNHTYWQYVIRVPAELRASLAEYLKQRKIENWQGFGPGIFYPIPMYAQQSLRDRDLGFPLETGRFPVVEAFAPQFIALPIFPQMTDVQVRYIAKAVRDFFESHASSGKSLTGVEAKGLRSESRIATLSEAMTGETGQVLMVDLDGTGMAAAVSSHAQGIRNSAQTFTVPEDQGGEGVTQAIVKALVSASGELSVPLESVGTVVISVPGAIHPSTRIIEDGFIATDTKTYDLRRHVEALLSVKLGRRIPVSIVGHDEVASLGKTGLSKDGVEKEQRPPEAQRVFLYTWGGPVVENLVDAILTSAHQLAGVAVVATDWNVNFRKFLEERKIPMVLIPEDFGKPGINRRIAADPALEGSMQEIGRQIGQWNADVGMVIQFSQIPDIWLPLAKKMTVNFHPSALPNYRGARPRHMQLYDEQKEFTVTWHQINSKIDQGPIMKQIPHIPIDPEKDRAIDLYWRFVEPVGRAAVDLLDDFGRGEAVPVPQVGAPERTSWVKDVQPLQNLDFSVLSGKEIQRRIRIFFNFFPEVVSQVGDVPFVPEAAELVPLEDAWTRLPAGALLRYEDGWGWWRTSDGAVKVKVRFQSDAFRMMPGTWGSQGMEAYRKLLEQVMSDQIVNPGKTENGAERSESRLAKSDTAGYLFDPKDAILRRDGAAKRRSRANTRSSSEVQALLRNAEEPVEIEAHLCGVDGVGSGLPEFPPKLTPSGALKLAELPSMTMIASEFTLRLRFEAASDPEAIEYVAPQYGHPASRPYVVKGKVKLTSKGRAPNGQLDGPAYIFSNVFGITGVRIICEKISPMALAGGMESSNVFNAELFAAASMLSGADWSYGDIFAEATRVENKVFGGFTGGQGTLVAILGGAYQYRWLWGVRDGSKNLVNPFSSFATKVQGQDILDFLEDHIALAQAGKRYLNGKAVQGRSAALINTMWMDLLRDEDPTAMEIYREMVVLAERYGESLRTKNIKAAVEQVNRFVDMRDELCRLWTKRVASQGMAAWLERMADADQSVLATYGLGQSQVDEINGIVKTLKSLKADLLALGSENSSSAKRGLKAEIKRLQALLRTKALENLRLLEKNGISLYSDTSKELIAAARREGISIMPTGAGGPGANLFAMSPKGSAHLRKFFYSQKIPKLVEKDVAEIVQGTGLLRGYMPFRVGRNPLQFRGFVAPSRQDPAARESIPAPRQVDAVYSDKTSRFREHVDAKDATASNAQVKKAETQKGQRSEYRTVAEYETALQAYLQEQREILRQGFSQEMADRGPLTGTSQANVRWKEIYGIPAVFWQNGIERRRLMTRLQDSFRESLHAVAGEREADTILGKLFFLEPATTHLTLAGFSTQDTPFSDVARTVRVESLRNGLRGSLDPELPLNFSIRQAAWMYNSLVAPVAPDEGTLGEVSRVFGSISSEVTRWGLELGRTSFLGHVTFAYPFVPLSRDEVGLIDLALARLSARLAEDPAEFRTATAEVYGYDNISFRDPNLLQRYGYLDSDVVFEVKDHSGRRSEHRDPAARADREQVSASERMHSFMPLLPALALAAGNSRVEDWFSSLRTYNFQNPGTSIILTFSLLAVVSFFVVKARLRWDAENLVREAKREAEIAEQRRFDLVLDLILTKAPGIVPSKALLLKDKAEALITAAGDFAVTYEHQSIMVDDRGIVWDDSDIWDISPTSTDKRYLRAMRDLMPKWRDRFFVEDSVNRRAAAAKILGELRKNVALEENESVTGTAGKAQGAALSMNSANRSETRSVPEAAQDIWVGDFWKALQTDAPRKLVALTSHDFYWVRIAALSRLAALSPAELETVLPKSGILSARKEEARTILSAYASLPLREIRRLIADSRKAVKLLPEDPALKPKDQSPEIKARNRAAVEARENSLGVLYATIARWDKRDVKLGKDNQLLQTTRVVRRQQQVRSIAIFQMIADMNRFSEHIGSLTDFKEALRYLAGVVGDKPLRPETISLTPEYKRLVAKAQELQRSGQIEKAEEAWADVALNIANSGPRKKGLDTGAVVVSKVTGEVLGIGYNGEPFGQLGDDLVLGEDIRYDPYFQNDKDYTARHKDGQYALDFRDNRPDWRRSICAEQRAIMAAILSGKDLKDAVLYASHSPCNQCTLTAFNAGIRDILYGDGFPDQNSEAIVAHLNKQRIEDVQLTFRSIKPLDVKAISVGNVTLSVRIKEFRAVTDVKAWGSMPPEARAAAIEAFVAVLATADRMSIPALRRVAIELQKKHEMEVAKDKDGDRAVLRDYPQMIIKLDARARELEEQIKRIQDEARDMQKSGTSGAAEAADVSSGGNLRSESRFTAINKVTTSLLAGLSALGALAGEIKPRMAVPGQLVVGLPHNGSFVIEASPSLDSWIQVGTITSAGAETKTFVDPATAGYPKKFYRVKFLAPDLPAGWTYLESNPNFATRTDSTNWTRTSDGKLFTTKTLKFRNLVTSSETLLLSWEYEATYSGYSVSVFVDPSGKTLFYSKAGDLGKGVEREILVKSLGNPALSGMILNSAIRSMSFQGNSASLTLWDGTVKNVDLTTLAGTVPAEMVDFQLAQADKFKMERFIRSYVVRRNYVELMSGWAPGVAPWYSFPDNGWRSYADFVAEFSPAWLDHLKTSGYLASYDVPARYVQAQASASSMRTFIREYVRNQGYENIAGAAWLTPTAAAYSAPSHAGRSLDEFRSEIDQAIRDGVYVQALLPVVEVDPLPSVSPAGGRSEARHLVVDSYAVKPKRSELHAGALVATESWLPERFDLPGKGPAISGISLKIRVATAVSADMAPIFAIEVMGLKAWAEAIKPEFFPDHYQALAEFMRGVDVPAALQVLKKITVTGNGDAIVVTPDVVNMGLLPVLRAIYQSSDIFVVGADASLQKKVLSMEGKMSALDLKTDVEFVTGAATLQSALAKKSIKRGVPAMNVSGLYTHNDSILADVLKDQVSDAFILVTAGVLNQYRRYMNDIIKDLMAEFQATVSRDRSA